MTKLYILFSALVAFSVQLRAQGTVPDDVEIQALLDFYNSTSGNGTDNWVSRWDRTKIINLLDLSGSSISFNDFNMGSDFPGVALGNGDVVSIILSQNNNIRGAIPSSINSLTQLRTLYVVSHTPGSNPNQIGGVLPNLSGLVKLQQLQLTGNNCTGIVDWLGSNGAASNELTYINLSSDANHPDKLTILPTSSFSNLINLNALLLDNNELTTDPLTVNNKLSVHFRYLDNLRQLYLNGCNLDTNSFMEFDFPEFDGTPLLNVLSLSRNPIVNVPSQIGNFISLSSLYLSSVGLVSLPSNFTNLDNLIYIDLSNNSLTNNTAFFDVVELLKGCTILNTLVLNHNNLSELPINFNQLMALRVLLLSKNPIGSSDLVNLSGSPITHLYLQACDLTDEVPSSLLNLPALEYLNLGNNITGASWATDPQRNELDLSSPGIENIIKNLQHVTELYMDWHALAGPAPLPAWFGSAEMQGITHLNLSNNEIQLPLPANFQLMTALESINFTNNLLNGSLPSFFTCTTFPFLDEIRLRQNQLTSFPDLSSCMALRILDVAFNEMSGDVPNYLGNFEDFYYLDVANNGFVNVPDFSNKSNHASFYAYLSNNYFDFEDISPFFEQSGSACNREVATLAYIPQKDPGKVGDASTHYVLEDMPITLEFNAPGTYNYYQWEVNNGGTWQVVEGYPSDPVADNNNTYVISSASPSNVGLYRTKIRNQCVTGLEFTGNDINVILVPPLCETEIPNRSGVFKLDKLTGSIVFERSDCSAKVPVSCVFGPTSTINNVVSAKAVMHSDDWSLAYLGGASELNPFESGERGKWRPKANYAYNAPLNQVNDKNYNSGTFNFKPFNWKYGEKSNYLGWLKVNQIEKYSPHGDPVEELNAIDIPSTAKFGYDASVPYLIAQNAPYASVFFESFEKDYPGGKFEDGFVSNGGTVVSDTYHAGKRSYRLNGATQVNTRLFPVTDQIKSNGIQVKMWVKGTVNNSLEAHLRDQANIYINYSPFIWIANSGEWALYEATFTPAVFTALSAGGSSFNVRIEHIGSGTIWMDDLRIQPGDAEMTTYVYDASSLRLLTVFDDQHFGLFYQYNAEGKLVRKMIETELGIKTVQETQYNMKKINK